MQDRWVTNLNEDRKSFFLIASLLDPHTKSLSFCDDTQVDLLHQDASVHQPSALSDLLGGITSMVVDVDSVEV
jgi:hypothetical protein